METVKKSRSRLYASTNAAQSRAALQIPDLKENPTLRRIIVNSRRKFSKEDFFSSKLGVEVRMGEHFKQLILPELSPRIPKFRQEVSVFDLLASRVDEGIRSKIGVNENFTPNEAIAILGSLVMKQPNGEEGLLANSSRANFAYVRLESGKVVSLGVWFSSSGRDCWWYFFADHLSKSAFKKKGSRIFAKSIM